MSRPVFSVVVPVYNRPAELTELLDSLSRQTFKDFEVIVVEDGSAVRSDSAIVPFQEKLRLRYLYKPNTGPGPSRNEGFKIAQGDWFVVFDSDCILPPVYFETVIKALQYETLDAWGGPDRPHAGFTLLQRAMGYTMSSVLTTGGIRGGKKRMGWFQPRSFNMGLSRKVFEKTKGFRFDRFAEDIELSIRMKNEGFNVGLIPDAYVYHKRRTNFFQFFKQVFNFGKGRALIGKVYPAEVKLTHWFPTLFSIAFVAMLLLPLFSVGLFQIALGLFTFYMFALFVHSLISNKSLWVALLSIPSALLQFLGYGSGFLIERFK